MSEFREFQDGQVVPGTRYRVLRLIGIGGMGSVYEVEHIELGKRFVLKALLRELARRDDLAQRLRNEWRALARLEHANIVNVTDAGTSATGVPYYVMERLDGDTLAVVLRKKRRLHVLDAVGVAASVLEALSAAHDIGIIHRDVKPANVFIVNGGGVKLLDFGIAKIADATSVVTARGLAVGTPRYMSPEQARGERVDGRSDIYATALILFEMIAGVGPFDDARDANELLLAHLAREAPPLSSLVMGVSAELERVVASMLAKDCRQRPTHARLAARDLREFAARQRSAPATDAPTVKAGYPAATLAAAQRITPRPVHSSITRPDGPARRSQPPPELTQSDTATTQHLERRPYRTEHTLSSNTGVPLSFPSAPNTTYVSAPSFDGNTTLEMEAARSRSTNGAAGYTQRLIVPSSHPAPAPDHFERPEPTEMLGEFTPAPAPEPVPTRTHVPLPERARPISVTPPPVVDAGRVSASSRRAHKRSIALGLAGVGVLLGAASLAHGWGRSIANQPPATGPVAAVPASVLAAAVPAAAPNLLDSSPLARAPEPAVSAFASASASATGATPPPVPEVHAPSTVAPPAAPSGATALSPVRAGLAAQAKRSHLLVRPATPSLGPFLRLAPVRKAEPEQPALPGSGL